MSFIVQSNFDTLLRYVLSVTHAGAAALKVMDQKRELACQKTLVKRRMKL